LRAPQQRLDSIAAEHRGVLGFRRQAPHGVFHIRWPQGREFSARFSYEELRKRGT
jgi:hypothetical protein